MSGDFNGNDILEQLFRAHYADMEAFARRFFSSPDIAQDVVQETFLVAKKNISALSESPKPIGWLMNTMKNVIGDTYRKRKRLIDISQPLELADGSAVNQIDVRINYEGLIGDEDLNLLIWIYCEDMTYEMAAQKLGISLAACKKRIQRAKLRMRSAIEKDL